MNDDAELYATMTENGHVWIQVVSHGMIRSYDITDHETCRELDYYNEEQ